MNFACSLPILWTPAAPTNYLLYRAFVPELIVIHAIDGPTGSLKSADWEFKHPGSGHSSHFGIGRDGHIVQWVPLDSVAYAVGNLVWNQKSYNIELEGKCGDPDWLNYPPMWNSLVTLTRELAAFKRIPIDEKHIIGHCHVPDPTDKTKFGGIHQHTDPGPYFPWPNFISALTTLPSSS